MTHFGILCPISAGHLNPMTTLGRELKRRGHRVTLFGFLDAQPKTLAAGLDFWAISKSEYPVGATVQECAQLGKLKGLAAFRYTVSALKNKLVLAR